MTTVGELVAGAVLGTLFSELYKAVKEMKGETELFREHLEKLNCTLESLKPLVFEEIGELNRKLGLSTVKIEDLQRKMKEGVELVGKLSLIRKRKYWLVKRSYNKELFELNQSLKVLLDTLKFQEAIEVKEILLLARKQSVKLVEVEELVKRVMEELLNVRQETEDAKKTLLFAVESSKQLVKLEESTRLLLDKPTVKRQAADVEETRVMVTITEMVLERVTENAVLKGLASLVQRTAVSTILQELFDALYKVKGKYRKLDFLKPLISIENMHAEYNNVLDHPKEELEKFKMLVEAALKLLLSKLCTWINHRKQKCKKLLKSAVMVKSLQKLSDILKVHELSNTSMPPSAAVRNMETVVLRLLDE